LVRGPLLDGPNALGRRARGERSAVRARQSFPVEAEPGGRACDPALELWCGTRRTEDWHVRYRASVVASGHLHIRRTDRIDGVRFEEVSLGYPPKQWDTTGSAERYLRQILPALE
jgi:hypothetical protein